MTKNKGAAVKIGSSKRPDNFVKKSLVEQPGPGNYMESISTMGKNVKGAATMGAKYTTKANQNPGPGQYSSDTQKLKKNQANCKIGTTKRPELWQKESKKDLPGPGNYMANTGTFGKNVKGAATMGSKHKQLRNENPGPG